MASGRNPTGCSARSARCRSSPVPGQPKACQVVREFPRKLLKRECREVARSIAGPGCPFHPSRPARQYLARMATSDLAILDAVRSTLGTHPRVVLAVSGGLDSMSLLDAAARAVDA